MSSSETTKIRKNLNHSLFQRSLRFLRPHRKLVWWSALLLPLSALTRLASPVILKEAVDGPIRHGTLEGLGFLAALSLILLLLQGVLNLLRTWVTQILGQKVITDLRAELFAAILRSPQRVFDQTPVGKTINRLTSDVEALNELLSAGLVEIVGDGLMLIGVVAVMFWMDASLAAYSLSLLIPLLIFVAVSRRVLRDIYSRLSAKNARSLAYSQEALSGLSVIQAFRRERASADRQEALAREACDEDLRGIDWNSALSAIVELAAYASIALMLYWGAAPEISLGTILAFVEFIQLFYRPVESLSGRIAVFQKALASAEKIFQLFDESAAQAEPSGSIQAPELRESIRFENLSFSYKAEAPVLESIDLEIRRGQTLALVGATGAGKSSLVKLLPRSYIPTAGRVLWDGQDIADFDLASLRRRISIVPQETFLFSEPLRANIDLAGGSLELARSAAQAVGADRIADELPLGYEQVLAEQGSDLSAGERQLIAFARALARGSEVLILDEATASIDGESEERIQRALREVLKGRTALVIAHRLSTIRDADLIVVMHKGRIREQGRHEELLAQGGLYHALWQYQGESPEDSINEP
jgi:ATP-binding cassette subfamily B multidrug efflux pump